MLQISKPQGKFTTQSLIRILAKFVVLFIFAFTPLFYSHILDLQEREAIKNATSLTDQKRLILYRIQNRISIPNEQAMMINIVNKEIMKKLSFYEVLQNGDKMFIFPKAKIAIIYNPYTDIVTGVVNVNDPGFIPYEKMAY